MQTNEMFAFWKGGATEQVRDGFIKNKLAIQRSDCGFERRKTFAVEMNALARSSDIQRSFLSVSCEHDSSTADFGAQTRDPAKRSWV